MQRCMENSIFAMKFLCSFMLSFTKCINFTGSIVACSSNIPSKLFITQFRLYLSFNISCPFAVINLISQQIDELWFFSLRKKKVKIISKTQHLRNYNDHIQIIDTAVKLYRKQFAFGENAICCEWIHVFPYDKCIAYHNSSKSMAINGLASF